MNRVPIHNVKPPSGVMSEAVANQLAEVISGLVAKAVDEALDQRLNNGRVVNMQGKALNSAGAGRFRLPQGD